MGLPLNLNSCIAVGIQCLPPELLEDIFRSVAAVNSLYLIQLLQVNRQWNEVIATSPRLWQRITLDGNTKSVSFLHAQAELWIQRSAPLPYHIDISVDDINLCLPLLTPFISSLGRWGGSTYHWRAYTYDVELPNNLEDFTELGVTIRNPEAFEVDPEDPNADLSAYLPWFSSHMLLPTVSRLPTPAEIRPINLTQLTLLETSATGSARPAEVMHFLSAFPQLTRLVLHLWANDLRETDTDPPVVSLPSLKRLELLNTFAPRLFLTRLHLPALCALRLVNLNVHHSIVDMFADAEDGDSADEAGDFSQSPWSDHGIGMGLRVLLKRSNPPLEALDMDYADMRTKDFTWCFDRLTTLRAFRIVGSDMSDTVINLLRPYAPRSVADDEPGRLRLRMPLLCRLDLVGCLRVSGDAVVAAILAREEFTSSHDNSTFMTEVGVVRCPGVDTMHDDSLRSALGPRFIST